MAFKNAPVTRRLNAARAQSASRKIFASTAAACFTRGRMADTKTSSRSPWLWVPTVYFAEGMPNALVATVSVMLYNSLGVSNEATAFFTSLLYLPWVIKPLWSPVVDILKTRRLWIWTMQLILGTGLAGVALMIPAPHFVRWTIVFFGLLAFSSATHDIAADGFYMLATTEREQSFFIGFRSVFFNAGKIFAQGALVFLAGRLERQTGHPALAWSTSFALAAVVFLCLGVYHHFILPRPAIDQPGEAGISRNFLTEFLKTFAAFFKKPGIAPMLFFLLLYRLGEAQLVKIIPIFLHAPPENGGLGLAIDDISLIYGTAGVIAFMFGALLGGFVVARRGLKFWLWPMLLAIHLPDAVFIWLAYAQPESLFAIGAGVAVEQFGYGFGFTGLMLYMIYIARGEHATAHYAICTGFMALGMMLPGMWSGWLQQRLGYPHFFVWVILATVPSFIAAARIPLAAEFGKRNQ
jgi:MFS transporter, PAT family, beta-lactamase induction signal transducer AmpG